MKLIIGIDEAGRGPLAGPVTVGVFSGEQKVGNWILKNIFNNKLRDSKKLSPKNREEIFKKLMVLKNDRTSSRTSGSGKVDFNIAHSTPNTIDKIGISKAISKSIGTCLNKIKNFHSSYDRKKSGKSEVRLDGLLRAPEEWKNQKTIIKGDEKDIFIACASIVAKVSRDKLMCKLAKKYPNYAFEIHKGYGTKLHRDYIKKFGISEIHRRSFCKKISHP